MWAVRNKGFMLVFVSLICLPFCFKAACGLLVFFFSAFLCQHPFLKYYAEMFTPSSSQFIMFLLMGIIGIGWIIFLVFIPSYEKEVAKRGEDG
jgi:hypothetical protein